jgi:hypothetical protein
MNIPSVGAVIPCRQTDGRSDMTMLAVVVRNFAPKNCRIIIVLVVIILILRILLNS